MSENTKFKFKRPDLNVKITWLLFFLIVVAVYFFRLDLPFIGPDEPRYSQVAREMFERGDWITPTLGGFDWFEKPVLLYWLQIASYKLFGVSEFAARFGSAVFGLGVIFALWILGKSVQQKKFDYQARNEFANWLALVAASTISIIVFARGASFDIILTFPMTIGLVSFFIWEQKNRQSSTSNQIYLIAFYFFTGIALLAKGLVGLIFPPAIVIFYYLLRWQMPPKSFIFSLFWGTLLSLLVASVWYLPMYQVNGWKFIDEFFIQHHFQRYTSNKYLHPQPFWFFFAILPLMIIPWTPFFLMSIWKICRNFKSAMQNPLVAFAFAWMMLPLVFFSFSGSKLPGYILPIVPAVVILTTIEVYQFVSKSPKRKILVQLVAFLVFAGVAFLAKFIVQDFLREETVSHLVETANLQGYKDEKILNMHTISHSVEFYGAGRLVREADGKQRKFYGVLEILEKMKQDNSRQVLVLVPLEYLYTLNKPELIETKVLDNNGELAVVLVKAKG
jgi:4-amino-4-deoxy-L-arabinose transferase-like glycosyltransferase